MSSQPAPQAPLPPSSPKSLKIVLIILVAIALLAVAGSYLLGQYWTDEALKQDSESGTMPSIEGVTSSYDNGDIDQAIALSQRLVDQNNADAVALLSLASSYAQKGSITFNEDEYAAKAIETANKVLALKLSNNSINAEAYRIIGYSYEIMEKYAEARVNYDKAIALDPKNTQALSNKGHSYHLQGDIKNAVIWYDKALAVDPENEHALLNKAKAAGSVGASSEALVAANKAIVVTKNARVSSEAHQIIAAIYFYDLAKFDLEKSLSHVNLAISLDPNVPQVWVIKGRIALFGFFSSESEAGRSKVVSEVEENVEKALSINPNQASAYLLALDLARAKKDSVKEKDLISKLRQITPLDITLTKNEKDMILKSLDFKIRALPAK